MVNCSRHSVDWNKGVNCSRHSVGLALTGIRAKLVVGTVWGQC